MSKGFRTKSGQGITRRGFGAGALGTGLILGTGRAPALEYEPQIAAGPDEGTPASTLPSWARWRPTSAWAIAIAIVAVFTITQMSRISEFIYWQF